MVGKSVRSLRCRRIVVTIAAAVATGSIVRGQQASAQTPPVGSRVAASTEAGSVTLDVDHAPLRTVLDAIARQAGLSIVYGNAVNNSAINVSLHVRNVSAREAFDRVLQGTDLTMTMLPSGHVQLMRRLSADSTAGTLLGTVTDVVTKRPLRGATVALDDSAKRVLTDEQGRYHFVNVSPGTHRVIVRLVGFSRESKSVTVGDEGVMTVNFAMASSVNTLDQVVVTATGAQRYRELGHVVTQLNADSLVKNAPITTFAELLQSRVPGLQVMTGNGGVAGGEVALRLRGQTTINLDPQPIVILDGVRYKSTNGIANYKLGTAAVLEDQRPFTAEQRSPLNDLNVNDIETVEVVKGPSASTLYGPDAANGVIVITTKHGQAGKPRWNFYVHPNLATISHEVQRPVTGYWGWGHDPSTGQPYQGSCRLVYQYEYHECILDSITVAPLANTYQPMQMIAKSRPQWQSGLSVSGGASAFRYFFSGGYDSQVGSISLPPASAKILEKLIGVSSLADAMRDPNSQQTTTLRSNVSADVNPMVTVNLATGYTQATQRQIKLQAYLSSVSYGAIPPGCDPLNTSTQCYSLASTDAAGFVQSTEMDDSRFTGAFSGTFRPLTWFSMNGTLGMDLDGTIDRGIDRYFSKQVADYRRNTTGRSATLNATARAHPGRFSFQTTLGGDYYYTRLDGLNAIGRNLAPGSSSISTATNLQTSQLWSETVSLGNYGEEVIGLNDRLFLTGSVRYDGSTSFGDAYDPHPFPKVGISWIASDEPWLRLPGLDQLRFRASLGAASRYPTSQMTLGVVQASQTSVEGRTQNVFDRTILANPVLRPERSKEAEGGIDATVLSGKVDIGMTWYHRRTNDQLQQLAEPLGLPQQWANVGDVSGHGSELTITARVIERQALRASVQFSSSFDTDKLLSLGPKIPICNGYDCYRVGQPLSSIYSQTITGVADTVGGGPDSVTFENEIVYSAGHYIGVLNPPHTYTLSPSAELFGGRIRISTLVDRATGFVIPDNATQNYGMSLAALDKQASLFAQAKTLTNCCAFSSGNYTRWRELSVSTDLPQRLVRLALLSRGTISFQVRNLALWTAYSGGDPESIPGQGTQGQGSVKTGYAGIAQPRSWSISFDFIP